MKKLRYLSWINVGAIFISSMGCTPNMVAPSTRITSTTPSTIPQVQQTWHGEKARVAVLEFKNKTGIHYQTSYTGSGYAVGNPIGSGMKEQLVTALHQTGAFIVLEREAISDVIGEQDLGASGRVKRETAAAIGEIEGAEFFIRGAVTEYTPGQTQAGAGLGIGARGGAALGLGGMIVGALADQAMSASMNKHHVAIDIEIIDARTSRIVHATSVEGAATDLGGAFGGIFGTTLVGLSGSYKTPIQKATRACIIKAVNWIADNALGEGTSRPVVTQAPIDSPRPGTVRLDPKIQKMQTGLNSLGYNCGAADGQRGPQTDACITRFLQETEIDEAALESEIEKRLSRRPPISPKPEPVGSPATPVSFTTPSAPETPPSPDAEWGE